MECTRSFNLLSILSVISRKYVSVGAGRPESCCVKRGEMGWVVRVALEFATIAGKCGAYWCGGMSNNLTTNAKCRQRKTGRKVYIFKCPFAVKNVIFAEQFVLSNQCSILRCGVGRRYRRRVRACISALRRWRVSPWRSRNRRQIRKIRATDPRAGNILALNESRILVITGAW